MYIYIYRERDIHVYTLMYRLGSGRAPPASFGDSRPMATREIKSISKIRRDHLYVLEHVKHLNK